MTRGGQPLGIYSPDRATQDLQRRIDDSVRRISLLEQRAAAAPRAYLVWGSGNKRVVDQFGIDSVEIATTELIRVNFSRPWGNINYGMTWGYEDTSSFGGTVDMRIQTSDKSIVRCSIYGRGDSGGSAAAFAVGIGGAFDHAFTFAFYGELA